MRIGESALVSAWYRGAWWLWLLRPLELVFRVVVVLRQALYRWGILDQFIPDKPVVVVGNITVGGTGKTPVVIALVEHLQSLGIHPGVVSRGYGAQSGSFPHSVGPESTADDCGDEALLIYQRTACACVVAPSRPAAVRQLVKDFRVDIILSDDGLQHFALGRNLEVAVLDHRRGIGNGFCLPAGPLREPVSRLETVDQILYRGSEDRSNGVQYVPTAMVSLDTGEERTVSAESLQEHVHAVAGIGQPRQFYESLEDCGFTIEEHTFSDHHHFCAQDLVGLVGKPIIMTEKDAVKCRAISAGNIWYLKIDAILPQPILQAVERLARH